jgi:uncharacterized protein
MRLSEHLFFLYANFALKFRAKNSMNCRPNCGACCTAPSITSPIPGMPNGKPAGVRCVQLNDENACKIFGMPERPAFCASLQPSLEMCNETREQAMIWLTQLEVATQPAKVQL